VRRFEHEERSLEPLSEFADRTNLTGLRDGFFAPVEQPVGLLARQIGNLGMVAEAQFFPPAGNFEGFGGATGVRASLIGGAGPSLVFDESLAIAMAMFGAVPPIPQLPLPRLIALAIGNAHSPPTLQRQVRRQH
jgi:hypothetical protein